MSENTIELNSSNFHEKTSKGNWVVDFWAEWCGPCKILTPVVEKVAGDFKGKVHFAKVDVDAEQDLAGEFDVMSIPTLLFIQNGQIVNRTVGAMSESSLKSKVQELL